MPGLTGKHIAQITNNTTQSSYPSDAPQLAGEAPRVPPGDHASHTEVDSPIPEAGSIHTPHGTAAEGGGPRGGVGQGVGVAPGPKGASGTQLAAMAGAAGLSGYAQVPSLGVTSSPGHPSLSPGAGNSSPRPRILRKRFERFVMDSCKHKLTSVILICLSPLLPLSHSSLPPSLSPSVPSSLQ